MSLGGGRSSFSWLGNFPSLYGVSSVSLNTRCILHETGKFSLYADLPTFSIITKGPTRLSASLAFGCSIFRFSESSQTRVPFVYSCVFVFLCLLYAVFMYWMALARASFTFSCVFCIFSAKSLAAGAWLSLGILISPMCGWYP